MTAGCGQLIVLKGPNRVGKTTVAYELVGRIKAAGLAVEGLAFPGRAPGTLGSHIYRLHHAPDIFGVGAMAPSARQALHVAAHLDVIERIIVPTLAKGVHVVLDRFWWSTMAYGAANGASRVVLEALITAERLTWDGWQADLAVVLDRSARDVDNDDRAYDDRLRTEYRTLVESVAGAGQTAWLTNDGSVPETVAAIGSLLGEARSPLADALIR